MKNENERPMTAAEEQAARDYLQSYTREWWAKQSPEERRARRLRYALNAAKRKAAAETETSSDAGGR